MTNGPRKKCRWMFRHGNEVSMKNILSNQYLLLISRLIIGLVFIVASIEKIAIPEMFAANIEAYEIIPLPLVNVAALLIPWIELLCGIFLISGFYLRSSSIIVSALLVAFIFLLSWAIFRGLHIDCGCFGVGGGGEVSWMRVLEDFLMLFLSVHIFYFGAGKKAAASPAG